MNENHEIKSTEDFSRHVVAETMRLASLSEGDAVGVALSGGSDSVALLRVIAESPLECHALHCNFGLRGYESDADERFSRLLAEKLGARWHWVRFDVKAEAEPGESVEMTCRRLRYKWFEEMADKYGLKAIAIGHHHNDSEETAMLNLLRGTGPRGLTGIAPRRDIYIRPMLGLTRSLIIDYLESMKQTWRTDSTNLASDYRRNALRNEILPLIDLHFPSGRAGIARTMETMGHAERLIDDFIDYLASRFIGEDGGIDVAGLAEATSDPQAALLLLLRRYPAMECSSAVVGEILACRTSGSIFKTIAGGHLELSRGILREYTVPHACETAVTLDTDIQSPIHIEVAEATIGEFVTAPRSRDTVWFDARILEGEPTFTLRHWRRGDAFRPFGMKGTRLLSDLFSDMKLNRSERESVWLLTRDEEIVWVVGIRSADCFRVGQRTQRIIRLTVKND